MLITLLNAECLVGWQYAAYTASRVDEVVEQNWDSSWFQAEKSGTVMRNMLMHRGGSSTPRWRA